MMRARVKDLQGADMERRGVVAPDAGRACAPGTRFADPLFGQSGAVAGAGTRLCENRHSIAGRPSPAD
jgi:hypothetical protein